MQLGTILIIDDDHLIQEMLKFKMQEHKIKTIHSYTISQANNIIKQKVPDLIMLDILLPGINGLEFLSYLKFSLLELHTPVILMSVLKNEEVKELGFKLGAKEYFFKPLNFDHLISSVKKHIKNANEESVFI